MNKKLRILSIAALSIACIFGFSGTVFAVDTNYVPLTTLPGVFKAGTPTNPVSVIKGVYGLAIGVGSVIAVVMIIFAGFKYMFEESISGKSGAKEQIQNALLGLIVILGSYILLRTINPALVEFDVRLPGGTGTVSGLAAKQREVEILQSTLRTAAQQSTSRVNELASLENTLTSIDGELSTLKGQLAAVEALPQNATNSAEANRLKAQIADAEGRKSSTQASIGAKKIDHLTTKWNDIITTSNGYAMANQITELSKQIEAGNNLAAIRPGAKNSLALISNNLSTEMQTLGRDIEGVVALNATGNDAKKEAYLTSAQQNMAYLAVSKSIIDSAKDSINQAGNFAGVNSVYEKINSDAQKKIADFQTIGRPDLVEKLQRDLKASSELFRIAYTDLCSQSSRTEIEKNSSLCKK